MDKSYKIGKTKLSSWIKEYTKLNYGVAGYSFYWYKGETIDGLLSYEDTNDATSIDYMFYFCKYLKHIPLFNTQNVVTMNYAFFRCEQLLEIPLLDLSHTKQTSHMLDQCKSLINIPAFDMKTVQQAYDMFIQCINIETVDLININCDLNIQDCKKMQQPALHKVIDNLLPQTSTKTLTLGITLLDRVSPEYKEKARQKGWTLA